MPVLENLVGGLANAAGSGYTANLVAQGQKDRKASAHEQLQANTKMILDEVQDLHEKKARLQPGTDDQAIGAIDKRLGELQGSFTDLYHPEKNPGALQHLGEFLKAHLGGKPQVPATPADAKAKFSWASGPAGTAPPSATEDKVGLWAKDATGSLIPGRLQNGKFLPITLPQGMTAEGTTLPKPEAENWVPTPVKMADGREVTLQRNSKSGEWTDLAGNPVSKDTLASASLVPKPAPGSNSKFSQEAAVYEQKWGKKIKDWLPEQLKFFNQEMAYEAQHGGSSTATRLVIDQNNQVIPVQVPSEHRPGAAPVEDPSWTPGGGASVPKTPGEAKSRAAASGQRATGGGGVHVGAALPITAKNPVEQKAHSTYIAAYQLSQAADLVSKEPDNAQGQKSLAVALERAAAGRFTTQALDYINKAGWSAGAEQFWNNIDNGTLPKVVMDNLIQRAHDNKTSAYAAWQEARNPAGDTGATAPQATGKAVSLAAARRLPAMQGKTDDQIRQAITAAGHQVAP